MQKLGKEMMGDTCDRKTTLEQEEQEQQDQTVASVNHHIVVMSEWQKKMNKFKVTTANMEMMVWEWMHKAFLM